MDSKVISNYRQPIILIISNNKTKLQLSSSILASFDRFQVAFQEQETLSWIQQHQPDLIILDLEGVQRLRQEESDEKLLSLVTTLKIDWLTRDIPLIAIADTTALLHLGTDLNYDACLSKPYSIVELEQKICSLVSTCECESSNQAI